MGVYIRIKNHTKIKTGNSWIGFTSTDGRRVMEQVSYRGSSYMYKTLIWKEGREMKRKGEREEKGGRKRSGAYMVKFYYMT